MKKAMVFGTFDPLHKGHISLFRQAKQHGDFLVVVVARDATVKKMKGRAPLHNEKKRLRAVSKAAFVDKAVLGSKRDFYKVVEKYKPGVICLGYDQSSSITKKLRQEMKKRAIKVRIVRMKPYKERIFKSSKLKKRT